MSELLARLARTLTHRWKISAVGAFLVVLLIGFAASAGGEAADDFSGPGTETQKAIDLFKAHSPALAGVDSTLVFTVRDGKVSDPGPRAAIEGALAEVKQLKGVDQVADPFAEGGTVSKDGKLAAVDVRYTTDPADIEKADGTALIAAGESAEKNGVSFAARGPVIDIG